MEAPPIQYVTTSDGYNIAYCVTGSGRPFVLMPEPFNHLHMIAASPTHRSLLDPLAERFKLVQYDPRGFGLSSRGLRSGHTIRDNIIDLEAVVDRLGLERFVLYGPYFYGTTAADYAAKHPERVEALILWNIDMGSPRAANVFINDVATQSWDLFLETFARTFHSYEDTAAAIARMRASVEPADFGQHDDPAWDIRSMLPSVPVPTLVAARRTPTMNLEAAGKEVAALIPDARLVLFDDVAGGHYTNDGSTPGLVHAIDGFLASLPSTPSESSAARPLTDGLSAREAEVLRLLALGKSNAQIADQLVISPNTVNRHVSNIYAKTGAANRAEAASYATRNGIA
jgi:DNA-binding CsgD family transcriptional regulator